MQTPENRILALTDKLCDAHAIIAVCRAEIGPRSDLPPKYVVGQSGNVTTTTEEYFNLTRAAHAEAQRLRPYFYDLATHLVATEDEDEEIWCAENGKEPPDRIKPVSDSVIKEREAEEAAKRLERAFARIVAENEKRRASPPPSRTPPPPEGPQNTP